MVRQVERYLEAERRLWDHIGVVPTERWVTLAAGGRVRVQEVGEGPPFVLILVDLLDALGLDAAAVRATSYGGLFAFRGAAVAPDRSPGSSGTAGWSVHRYATVSVWRDDDALDAFASAQPHAALMTRLAPEMNEPRFVRWSMSGDDGIPTWDEVSRRLA